MKRTLLITGGAGFIGSHVIRRFVNKYPDYKIVNADKLTYAGNLGNLTFRLIRISDTLQPELDYSSKLSRSPQLIDTLMAEGNKQVEDFMRTLNKPGADPERVLALITE